MIRSQQLRTLAQIFTLLTWIDVMIIIFAAIAEKDNSLIRICFQGCAIPIASHGATYLSFKILYDVFCP
jgi:hypothetical protein